MRQTIPLLAPAVLLATTGHAQETQLAFDGQLTPIHLEAVTSPAGSLLVSAHAGTGNDDGAVLLWNEFLGQDVLVESLPSVLAPEGLPSGPHQALIHITETDLHLYVALGKQGDISTSSVLHFDLLQGEPPYDMSDATVLPLGQFMSDQGYADSNAYDIAVGNNGHLYIVDAGANAIVRYRHDIGNMKVLADIPGVPNNTGVGPPVSEAVPTGIANYGNRFLVSTLTGFPFQSDVSTLYIMNLQGELSVAAEGLSQVTDVAVNPIDGSIAVAQFAEWELVNGAPVPTPGTGSVVVMSDKGRFPLLEGLVFPTGLAYDEAGRLFFQGLTGACMEVIPGFQSYCEGSANSVFSEGASMAHAGSASISANDLTLICQGVPPGEMGLFLYGWERQSSALGQGVLCVGGSKLFRLGVVQSDASGSSTYPFDNTGLPSLGTVEPGSVIMVQHWYRDGSDTNLSNALQIMFGA